MSEYEIYNYEAYRSGQHDELRTFDDRGLPVFQEHEVAAFLLQLRREKTALESLDDALLLELQGIVHHNKATLCGVMMFGLYPQSFFPQYCILALVVQGTTYAKEGCYEERFIDNKKFIGNIPTLLIQTEAFVRRHSSSMTRIDAQGNRCDQDEYPEKAVRELILNALLHRDYSIYTQNTPIRLVLYADRLEIENPGGLYGHVTIDELGKTIGETRNPFIADAMEILKYTENRYTGIPTIRFACQKAGLEPPEFEVIRGCFRATIYNRRRDRQSSWNDHTATMEERILKFCQEQSSREELAKLCSLDSISYMMKVYVQPLLQADKLQMTLPDVPKSKKQRYLTKPQRSK